MATITRENIGLLNDKITVNVTQEDYLPNFDKVIRQFSKTASLPGFRKGMVPAGLIKKMHGPAIFSEEVLKSVEKELGAYLQQEKLDIFAQPISLPSGISHIDMNNPQEYSFGFEIGLKPSFDVPALKGHAPLTRYNITVSDEMIDREVERLQLKGGKMTDPETITSDDNVVNVVFDECDEKGTPVEGGIQKDNSLLVKYFSPAIRQELTGKKKDDTIVFRLADSFDEESLGWVLEDLGLPKDDPEAKQKYFRLTITKVGLLEKRELDEAFFNEIYPNQHILTADDFRNRIREEMESHYAQESRHQLQDEIFEILVHETPLDLPVPFLKKWMQTGGEKRKTPEEVEQEYPQFDHQLRWTLISDKLVRENGITVTRDEIKDTARQRVLGYYGIPANTEENLDWLDAYTEKMASDEKYVEQSYRELVNAKLFDWLEKQFTLEEKTASAEEFTKLPHKHHHHHEH